MTLRSFPPGRILRLLTDSPLTSLPRPLSLVRLHALEIIRGAISAVGPAALVRSVLRDHSIQTFLGRGPVTLVAAGKATQGMIQGFVTSTDLSIRRGIAVGIEEEGEVPAPIIWYRGGHPVPVRGSVEAGRAALRFAAGVSSLECLVVLLSGGASALMAAPAGAVTLKEKVDTTRVLLGAGVPIHELNCVRKHLSAVKGGRLALATPGRVLTLAISDVVSPIENDPSVIGSGPTVGDETTFTEALAIVDRPGIRERVPPGVFKLLQRGRDGLVSETMQDGNLLPERSMYRVIGSRREAMDGALLTARKLGYQAIAINGAIEGEARVVGGNHPERVLAAAQQLMAPRCVVSSGETTVNVSGNGRGGRNQELALAALSEMSRLGSSAVLASVGTDGVDGPTDAAGAMVDSTTAIRASALGLTSPESYLAENNAYAFFDQLGDLVRTGPTGTNVGDLQVVLTQ